MAMNDTHTYILLTFSTKFSPVFLPQQFLSSVLLILTHFFTSGDPLSAICLLSRNLLLLMTIRKKNCTFHLLIICGDTRSFLVGKRKSNRAFPRFFAAAHILSPPFNVDDNEIVKSTLSISCFFASKKKYKSRLTSTCLTLNVNNVCCQYYYQRWERVRFDAWGILLNILLRWGMIGESNIF